MRMCPPAECAIRFRRSGIAVPAKLQTISPSSVGACLAHENSREAAEGLLQSCCERLKLSLNATRARILDLRRENRGLRATVVRLEFELREALSRDADAQRLARRDSLTGLPNRLQLKESLQSEIVAALEEGREFAVLFIDIDGFKQVNDDFGHATGDKLLTAVAARISSCVRAGDVASRYGGDEFVVLLSTANESVACKVAALIREHIAQRFSIDGIEYRVTASVGIAIYPRDGGGGGELLVHADASMYQSRNASVI